MPMLHIQLLGDFRLTYDDKPLTAIVHARQQALLAYLLLHRDAPQSRHHLAFLFWPDTGETQALTNLRNLLHKLRRELPEPERFLDVNTQTVQWRSDSAYKLDVAEFTTLAKSSTQSDLGQAIGLYRGALLPSCYDEWIVAERDHLQQVMLDVLEKLISQLESAQHYSDAIRYAQQLIQHDPLSEKTYRRLMQLHALNQDRASVMHIYHTCATILQRELGVMPSEVTQQFYQELLNLQPLPPSTRAHSAMPPLIGRENDLARLLSLWNSTTPQHPQLVVVKGEAGIGKTRLIEELVH